MNRMSQVWVTIEGVNGGRPVKRRPAPTPEAIGRRNHLLDIARLERIIASLPIGDTQRMLRYRRRWRALAV